MESMASSVPQASVWQLDFCSRPVVDERGKKKWELMICDENRSFEFARFFTNNQINSAQVSISSFLRWVEQVSCSSSVVIVKWHNEMGGEGGGGVGGGTARML